MKDPEFRDNPPNPGYKPTRRTSQVPPGPLRRSAGVHEVIAEMRSVLDATTTGC